MEQPNRPGGEQRLLQSFCAAPAQPHFLRIPPQLLFLGSQLNVSREDVWNTPWIEYLLLPRTHAHTCTHARTYTHTAHVLVHLSINGEEQKHTEAAPSFTEGVRFCTSVIASVLGRQRCRVQPFNESRTDTLTFSQAVVCPRLRAEDP